MYEPANDNGIDTENHRKIMKNNVLAGITPEECANNKKKFIATISKKIAPGSKIGVIIKLAFQ